MTFVSFLGEIISPLGNDRQAHVDVPQDQNEDCVLQRIRLLSHLQQVISDTATEIVLQHGVLLIDKVV